MFYLVLDYATTSLLIHITVFFCIFWGFFSYTDLIVNTNNKNSPVLDFETQHYPDYLPGH